MLRHADANVPGYHFLFKDAGINVSDIRTFEDLASLPFTDKSLIRDNLADFTARNFPRSSLLYRATGGSTGMPFGFYLTQQDIQREFAFIHRAWEEAGWNPGDWSAVLRGAFIGSPKQLSETDPLLNELRLSTYYLTGDSYPAYRRKLSQERIRHLQAYPSAAMILADLVLASGDAGRLSFKSLLLGSENLYAWQRKRISQAFPEARILSWYGHAEQVLFAPECPGNTALHLNPYYGLAEILGPDHATVGEGESGELIGTSLWNMATPFIRYRTLDFAERGRSKCESCGREFNLLVRIDGRLQEFVVTSGGRYVSMTQINMHSDLFDRVKRLQFHQERPGVVTLRLVRKEAYTEDDTRRIRREIEAKLGADMELRIAFVDHIAPLPSGKFSFLDQELQLQYGDYARHS